MKQGQGVFFKKQKKCMKMHIFCKICIVSTKKVRRWNCGRFL